MHLCFYYFSFLEMSSLVRLDYVVVGYAFVYFMFNMFFILRFQKSVLNTPDKKGCGLNGTYNVVMGGFFFFLKPLDISKTATLCMLIITFFPCRNPRHSHTPSLQKVPTNHWWPQRTLTIMGWTKTVMTPQMTNLLLGNPFLPGQKVHLTGLLVLYFRSLLWFAV